MPAEHKHMSHEEKRYKLLSLIDDVCTYLYSGTHWHQKAAQCARKISIRGFGRLHEYMSKIDFADLQCIEKLSIDKLQHIPMVDMEKVTKAEAWEMHDISGFRGHFDDWIERESSYIGCINEAIHYSREIDVQLYNELVCLADRVQNEIFRVKLLGNRLAFGGWSPHDIAYVSQVIHEYYEHGEINLKDPMDYNLG